MRSTPICEPFFWPYCCQFKI